MPDIGQKAKGYQFGSLLNKHRNFNKVISG